MNSPPLATIVDSTLRLSADQVAAAAAVVPDRYDFNSPTVKMLSFLMDHGWAGTVLPDGTMELGLTREALRVHADRFRVPLIRFAGYLAGNMLYLDLDGQLWFGASPLAATTQFGAVWCEYRATLAKHTNLAIDTNTAVRFYSNPERPSDAVTVTPTRLADPFTAAGMRIVYHGDGHHDSPLQGLDLPSASIPVDSTWVSVPLRAWDGCDGDPSLVWRPDGATPNDNNEQGCTRCGGEAHEVELEDLLTVWYNPAWHTRTDVARLAALFTLWASGWEAQTGWEMTSPDGTTTVHYTNPTSKPDPRFLALLNRGQDDCALRP